MRRYSTIAAAVLLIITATAPSIGAPGVLDGDFGVCGVARAGFPGGGTGGTAFAVQSDGKIVGAVTHSYHYSAYPGSYDPKWGVVRFLSNGNLDATYGSGGRTVTVLGPASYSWDMTLDSLNRAIVVGESSENLVVARYTSSGVLDASFDYDGLVIFDLGAQNRATDVIADGDTILVAGFTHTGTDVYPWLIRFAGDGSVDPDFGVDGLVDLPAAVQELAIQGGDILVAMIDSTYGHSIMRLDPTGAVDPTFGGGGEAHLAFGSGSAIVEALKVLPDGKFVIAGYVNFYDTSGYQVDIAVSRFTVTGTADSTFNDSGTQTLDLGGHELPSDFSFGPSGSLYIGGRLSYPGAFDVDAFLAKVGGDGSWDPTFGYGGAVATDFGYQEAPKSVMAASDGAILLGGTFSNSTGNHAGVARYSDDQSLRNAGFILDGYGGLHPYSVHSDPAQPCAAWGPYWPGFDIARDVAMLPDGSGGIVLDGYGGVHPFGTGGMYPTPASGGPWWPGWDIAESIDITPDGTGGVILDVFGGVHSFALGDSPEPVIGLSTHFGSWGVARAVALMPDGTGGIYLDAFGGLHSFSMGSGPQPTTGLTPKWEGWDIARDVAILPDGSGGLVLDGWGHLHGFSIGSGSAPTIQGGPFWQGWDIARAVVLLPDGSGGYVLDGWGSLHPFGLNGEGIPSAAKQTPYWYGFDIANAVG